MNKIETIVVTGAAGQIAYALLPLIASGSVFAPEINLNLVLLDIPAKLRVIEGVAMELADCAFSHLAKVSYSADVNTAMVGADWAILIGAAPRKAGMERSKLLAKNGPIFHTQGQALNNHANPNVKVIVVGNPCNTNALIAQQAAPNIPSQNFFAMTTLDELRAKALLAQQAGVDPSAVTNLIAWGNHSPTIAIDYHHALINNKPISEVIDNNWLEQNLTTIVRNRGAEIIQARGASSALSAAYACAQLLRGLAGQLAEPFSAATYTTPELAAAYNLESGLIYSLPCQVNSHRELTVLTNVNHSPSFQQQLKVSEQELITERDQALCNLL